MRSWVKKRTFDLAALLAVVVVVISGVSTYRAFDELPTSHEQLITLEEQVGKLVGIRSEIRLCELYVDALVRTDPRPPGRIRDDFVRQVARGQQLASEIIASAPDARLLELARGCEKQFEILSRLAAEEGLLDDDELALVGARNTELLDGLNQSINSGRRDLINQSVGVTDQRRKAVLRAISGHCVILAVVGLLYFARRREIAKRRDADLKMLESDERFALIVRGSADGMILTDASGRIQLANQALEQMFLSDQMVGKSLQALFETTLIDQWTTDHLKTEDDRSEMRTVIAKRSDGTKFDAELNVTRQCVDGRELLAISVRDVTERQVSRLTLKQHEALLREIPEPIHITDSEGHVVYWNAGAQAMFGYSPSEAIGKSANDLLGLIPPKSDGDNIHITEYAQAERWTGELDVKTKDGRQLRVERRRTRIREAENTIGEVIFDFDLAERNRAQRTQRRVQRVESLGTLASGIAHDLNNLLTPILMSSRMLQRGGDNLDREAMLETIVAGATRGADLIGQLLTFARGGEAQHCEVEIVPLVADVAAILERTLKNNISLRIKTDPDLPTVMGDATEISQVIMNLAINARDAMPDGGTLTIGATRMSLEAERTYSLAKLQPGDYVAVSVRDTGKGIPPNIRDRIFEPFFTTKERGQGTGLGLSTTLGIVRSHSGAIDIETTVGVGTELKVIFPISQPSSE